ncbi:hypothetical protein JNJ66_06225 [Candidatus Saccharibacteria bacterium]|nr:hypothetical protein [Candidatus Saccharibacteria bacterium]
MGGAHDVEQDAQRHPFRTARVVHQHGVAQLPHGRGDIGVVLAARLLGREGRPADTERTARPQVGEQAVGAPGRLRPGTDGRSQLVADDDDLSLACLGQRIRGRLCQHDGDVLRPGELIIDELGAFCAGLAGDEDSQGTAVPGQALVERQFPGGV